MNLEAIGKILAGGFGNRVAVGIFMGLWDKVTPQRLYQYLKDDLKPGYWIAEKDWQRYRRLAKQANIGDITSDDIVEELRKHHPDLLGVILNHPEGMKWLDNQITEIKKKLGLG